MYWSPVGGLTVGSGTVVKIAVAGPREMGFQSLEAIRADAGSKHTFAMPRYLSNHGRGFSVDSPMVTCS
jgi:hypothetical protein